MRLPLWWALCTGLVALAASAPPELEVPASREAQDAAQDSTEAVDQMPMEARDSEIVLDEAGEAPYHTGLPGPYVLNGGKPFFLEKDPVTGALDFSGTKTAPAVAPAPEASDRVIDTGNSVPDYDYEEHDGIDRKDTAGSSGRPNDLGSPFKIVTPNFHDFLNLPVKYSSSGDKYPLISSSYANTKVQGTAGTSQTHNGGIKNHKPYSTSSTSAPHYYTIREKPSSLAPSSTTTTTTTTTPAPTYWGLDSEEYPDKPPNGNFGMKPPKVPISAEERPGDYEYSYEDEEPALGATPQKPQTLHNAHQPQPDLTEPQTSPYSSSTSTSTSTTTTTTTSTTTRRPTTSRPQLSTVKILRPFNRQPVVVTSRPAEPSSTLAVTSKPTTSTMSPTSAATPSATTTVSITEKPTQRVTTPSTPSTKQPSSTMAPTTPQRPLSTSPANKPDMSSTTAANVVLVPEKPSTANKVVFEIPPHARPSLHPVPPTRDSPYGLNQPFRPLYDNVPEQIRRPLPAPPGFQQVRPPPPPPSGFGDVITAPLPGDQSGSDNNYVSFSFQPPSPQQIRIPGPMAPRFPGVEPPRPNPPQPFLQPAPPPHAPVQRPPSPVREDEEPQTNVNVPPPLPPAMSPPHQKPVMQNGQKNQHPQKLQNQQKVQGVPNSQNGRPTALQQQQAKQDVPATTIRPGHVVFPDEKRDQITQDTKEIIVQGSFQHPPQGSQGRPPFGQVLPPYRGAGQVLDGQLPPFRAPLQGDGKMPPYMLHDQMADSNREGSEQQPIFQAPPHGSPLNRPPPREPMPSPATDLMPPADPGKNRPHPSNDYPRPHWETSRPKPPGFFSPPQGLRPKLESLPPQPMFSQMPPMYKQGPRIKPGQGLDRQGTEPMPDSGLPNILPQFRPNARLSGGHQDLNRPHYVSAQASAGGVSGQQRMPLMERPGAGRPHSILPPPAPQHMQPLLRVNRNDDAALMPDLEIAGDLNPDIVDIAPVAAALQRPHLHRRSGPHIPSFQGNEPRRRVATLQMMQQQGSIPVHRVLTRADLPAGHPALKPPFPVPYQTDDKPMGDRPPVFVVYPSNSAKKRPGSEEESGVVVGSRGPNKPVPPTSLKLDSSDEILTNIDDEPLPLPFAVHKQQKPLLNPSRDRNDSPILKPHRDHPNSLSRPGPTKSEFPYAIVQPELPDNIPQSVDPYRQPPADKRKDEVAPGDNHDDSEINVIPYLQDYMPFATKKPLISTANPKDDSSSPASTSSWSAVKEKLEQVEQDARIVVGSGTSAPPTNLQPISVTLKTVAPSSRPEVTAPVTASTPFYRPAPPPSRHETVIGGGSGGSEFTVGAVMHTLSNHRQAEGPAPPEPDSQGFQAPFQASVSVESVGAVPVREGWSVVSNTDGSMKPGTVDKADIRDIINENMPVPGVAPGASGSSDNTTFDFENFKPQLFGGFKPILPSEDAPKERTAPQLQEIPAGSTGGDREERKLA